MPVVLDDQTRVVDRRGANVLVGVFAAIAVLALVLFLVLKGGDGGSGDGGRGASNGTSQQDSGTQDSGGSDSQDDATSGGSTGETSGDQTTTTG